MAVLELLIIPDERLKQPSASVTEFDQALMAFVANLEQTRQQGPAAVGIAAPQVGHFQRIAIVDISSKPKMINHGRMVLINPEITEWDGMVMGREGCMSVPDYTGNVIRAEAISFTAFDEFGEPHEYTCEGFEARAIQHEVDHLDGMLFLDRLVSRRSDLFRRKVYKQKDVK